MNKVAKKILDIGFDILIAILVIFAIVISISTFTSKSNNGVPNLFGYSPFSVQTGSMEPTINPGDYILVEKCDAENLKVGDIISYFTIIEGKTAINTHRIVDVADENGVVWYQTQGDNKVTNPDPDEALVAPGDVIGKYNGLKVPVLGHIMDFLSSKWGFFCVILIPVLLFTIVQIYKLIAAVIYNKKIAMMEEVAENTSDDVKEAIIAEYLAKQKEENAKQDNESE